MNDWRQALPAAALLATGLAAGAALRFAGLEERPMHADEAVLADKFGTLLEEGAYRYDPHGHHGPALLYLTLPAAKLRREHRYEALRETTLRAVPVVAGLLLAGAPFLLAGGAGRLALGFASLFTAVSPAMVYYSRYYIPEMPLTLFVFTAVALGYRSLQCSRSRAAVMAVLAGLGAGAAWSTKETALLAFAASLAAAAIVFRIVPWKQLLIALGAAGLSAGLFLSSFLSNPAGVADAVRSYFATYIPLAWSGGEHIHPWHFYLGLLLRAEPALLALAAGGVVLALRRPAERLWRLLALFALLLFAVYSAMPYKTPWCLLAFWQPALLLAGYGAARLTGAGRGPAAWLVWILLGGVTVSSAAASWRLARDQAAAAGNPYTYAQTLPDVLTVRRHIEEAARIHPDGRGVRVQIFTTRNWWPLPWYLRDFPNARWSRGVPAETPPAPLILASPDLEAELSRKLYEQPPPGEREIYLNLFEQPLAMRPGVEVRGYVAYRLWEQLRRNRAPQP